MSRSLKKGIFTDEKLMKKVRAAKPGSKAIIKTWARSSMISPEMVGLTFGVHNGRDHISVFVTEDMVGFRLGEFSLTKKFVRHGGKLQREVETKAPPPAVAPAKK